MFKTRHSEISELEEPCVLQCVTGPANFSFIAGICHEYVNHGKLGFSNELSRLRKKSHGKILGAKSNHYNNNKKTIKKMR